MYVYRNNLAYYLFVHRLQYKCTCIFIPSLIYYIISMHMLVMINTHTYMCAHHSTCMYAFTNVCTHKNKHICIHMHMQVHTHICMHVCTCMCTHTHTSAFCLQCLCTRTCMYTCSHRQVGTRSYIQAHVHMNNGCVHLHIKCMQTDGIDIMAKCKS